MKYTIRTKLLTLVFAAGLTFILNTAINHVMIKHAQKLVHDIQSSKLAKVNLISNLQVEFRRVGRQLQDAASSLELSIMQEAAETKGGMLASLERNQNILGEEETIALVEAIEQYYQKASEVSLRVIEGRSGEDFAVEINTMQRLQMIASDLMKKTLDEYYDDLQLSFESVSVAQGRISKLSIYLGAASFILILLLFTWFSRKIIKSMNFLTDGLSRFGAGEFKPAIPIIGNDDISYASKLANDMAEKLEKSKLEKEKEYWLKDMLAQLSSELRGDLGPKAVVDSVIRFFGHHFNVHVDGVYYLENENIYLLSELDKVERRKMYKIGEGLIGQSIMRNELTIIVPTETKPTINPLQIVYLPLYQSGEPLGLVELSFYKEIGNEVKEFLLQSTDLITTSMNVAISRRNIENLLVKTQDQATKLMEQENDLHSSNDELQRQRAELEQANQALEEQKEVLEIEKSKLEELTGELEASRREVEEKIKVAEEANQYKSQFLANMSHELRTPLNSIMVLSQLLFENRDNSLGQKQVKSAKIIHSAGRDLLSLIDDILDLAKIEAGKVEILTSKVNIDQVASHLENLFRAQTQEKEINFFIDLDDSCPAFFYTDQKRLEQILKNLISNAIKFTEKGSVKVTFKLSKTSESSQEKAIEVSVEDTGIGISKDKIESIFEAFQQADSSVSRKYSGTGLGLTISKNLAMRMGGDLVVSSEEGKGSIFTVTLPELVPVGMKRSFTEVPKEPTKKKAVHTNARELPVLIVEDNVEFTEVLQEKCKEYGFDSISCKTAEEALRFLKKNPVRAILLDVGLPGMDGLSFLKQIRRSSLWKDIPVHVISVEDVERKAMELDASSFYQKPVSSEDLHEILEKIKLSMPKESDKILLIELDDDEVNFVSKHFSQEGIQTKSSHDLDEVKEELAKDEYGCIVMGIGPNTQNVSGYLDYIHEQSSSQGYPVIFFTEGESYSDVKAKVRDLQSGVILKRQKHSQRLLDEVSVFLHHIEDRLPSATKLSQSSPYVESSLEGRKVLIAEDDARNIYTMKEVLSDFGMYVFIAENGLEAIDVLNSTSEIDLVLMDMMMPVMDGVTAIKKIREDPKFKDLPIIAITAKAMKHDREICLEAGANDYLSKPVDIDELLQLLKIWILRH